ncbi:hypothetical protein BDN67DRAFT_992698 [Paxillus ammoniavirescens]|nr:hypothetical protein BDN67DRAFT_992698 [Paxillus ammoniavirescens]
MSDDEEEEQHEPPQIEQSQRKKAALQGKDLLPKLLKILDTIREEELTLSLFLDALSWGDEACMASDCVHYTLETFTIDCVTHLLEHQMEHVAPHFISPPSELAFIETVKWDTPLLWRVMEQISYSDKQRSRNTHKDPDMGLNSICLQVILHQISQVQYTLKPWAIYLKSCGLSARAFDTLHKLGTIMSHKWTANAYRAWVDVQCLPWIISDDNVNLPMRVFSQRLHNQSHFISGCTATGLTQSFSLEELLDSDLSAHLRIKNQFAHHVLQILLHSPDFSDYMDHNNEHFQPPPAVNQLAYGPDHIVQQRILHTTDQEEASYKGNDKAIEEFFHQLGISSKEEMQKTGSERLIAWIGDQLTVERLRGLFKYRHEDFNSFDRMDYMIPVFGWFHLVMAFANSLHKQYLGNAAITRSLQQAFDVLQRKGLQKSETKGPFWHHLHKALYHVGEAHIRATWQAPAELHELAIKLVDKQASRKAHAKMMNQITDDQDNMLIQWTMFHCNVLSYIEFNAAMKCDMLPTCLFWFASGGNSKYIIKILELMQGLRCEWPDVVKDYMWKYCWLINHSGKPDGFTPVNKAQEQDIQDIKRVQVTYHSFGPGATFEYLHKILPAIPTLHALHPDKEADVTKLMEQYVKSKIHLKGGIKHHAQDYINKGAIDLERLGTFNNWWSSRAFARSRTEEWGSMESEPKQLINSPVVE